MNNTKKSAANLKRLTSSAVCLALCMLLPLITGQNPMLGSALGLMHIPVLLCGFAAGPAYAAVVGLIAPLMRSTLFGMPPLVPMAISMSYELAAYGMISGTLYKALPKKIFFIYVSLVAAMLLGRVVFGMAMAVVTGSADTMGMFIAAARMFTIGAFVDAIPGIILHIALIPPVVAALRKAGLSAL